MQFRKLFVLAGAALALVGCGALPPQKVSSQYLTTEDGGFVLNRERREVTYMIALVALKPIPGGSLLEGQFENPGGGPPLTSTRPVGEGQTKFVVASPPVTGLKAGTRYKVQIRLYSDAAKSQLLDSYTQEIRSFVNQADLRW